MIDIVTNADSDDDDDDDDLATFEGDEEPELILFLPIQLSALKPKQIMTMILLTISMGVLFILCLGE